MLPAITVDGLLDVLLYKGYTNTEGFVTWLGEYLLPKINRFPDRYSILVMDNASWYRNKRVRFLYAEYGVLF